MPVFKTILTICFCFGLSAQTNIEPNNLFINGQSAINQTTSTINYSIDQQTRGFNGSNFTSGPIIIADKRTLFIPDLRNRNSEKVVEFWAGAGNPYGSNKYLVHTENLVNPINLYVILPQNFSLDTIDFFQATLNNKSLDYVGFENVNRSLVKNYDQRNMEDTVFRIPKCCLPNEYLNDTLRDCGEAYHHVNFAINIFESNETGLDPDLKLNSSDYRLIPYHRTLHCDENGYKVMAEGLHGLIYNSSLIIQGTGILSHGEYCFDVLALENGTSNTAALYCYYQSLRTSDPDFYLPVLIISAICFAFSAAAYGLILKAKDIHKRCFIIFSSSMCLAFVSLIIMMVQSNNVACNLFGFVFLGTIIFSFLWWLILCLDLLYLVVYPLETQRSDLRWYWYVGTSLSVTFLIFLVSLFSGQLWVPDVPNSFIMNYRSERCEFETTFGRTFIIFIPMIISIVGSIASLSILRYYINKNQANRDIETHVDWITNHNSYKFLSRTYFFIVIVASFWIGNIFFYSRSLGSITTQLAFDVIKASLGIVTCIGFVGNKYTIAEIKGNFCKKKQPITEESLGLNGLPTPDTPLEMDPLVRSNNSNNIHNNRFINNG